MPLLKTQKFVVFGLILVVLSSTACKEDQRTLTDTTPIAFSKEGELEILKSDTDTVLAALDIELALTDYEIQTGLMYRKSMEANQGMLFVFQEEAPHSFYMKNTLISLDILFIDKDLRIVNIQKNTTPLSESGIPSSGPVQYVLEINAGLSDRWKLAAGDRIRYEKIP
ncbi:DUF192 domain-containing protein [Robiginitalea aurantiaca]|uniref:DUF192 domain-containing protein n=1 Tax=Robiginitalea aurantiaca TaxID=3056915 RepID=A0ABT7WDG2_9FLAO|nr:DUF192 domain-containing protein [Robiginitalea aurantiaca]MDM9630963.1 DUF192 domain-containing protein [Robiginitalea aurantiaca]